MYDVAIILATYLNSFRAVNSDDWCWWCPDLGWVAGHCLHDTRLELGSKDGNWKLKNDAIFKIILSKIFRNIVGI